jgi:hypothetical protein
MYAQAAVIRSKRGLFLPIPTPAAGFGDGRRKITPGAWERIHGMWLRFVYRWGSPSLIADNARLTTRGRGGKQRSAARRRVHAPLGLYHYPAVRPRAAGDGAQAARVDRAARKWIAALPQLVARLARLIGQLPI